MLRLLLLTHQTNLGSGEALYSFDGIPSSYLMDYLNRYDITQLTSIPFPVNPATGAKPCVTSSINCTSLLESNMSTSTFSEFNIKNLPKFISELEPANLDNIIKLFQFREA